MDTTVFPFVSKSVEDAIFETAQSLKPDDQESLLRACFRGNPEGLARVRRMLDRRGESAAFFLDVGEHGSRLAEEILNAEPAEASSDGEGGPREAAEIGSMIGPYRIRSRLGDGGSGVVYEAEQQSPVQRIVALKVLRPGMDTENVLARFKVECQALALMDHPNIAHVHDAGSTPAGRPYFVMERVSGERLTTACDRAELDVAARIDLFVQVCHGVQHAHQKGVVHRDLKPSNILVTEQDGKLVPKVIDFGIAKATDPSLGDDRTLWTVPDQIIGTPPYMSPEQVDMSGIDVDTRTDVYSLGALLYELLGGRPPFEAEQLARAGISEMRRILREDNPPLVSRMFAALPAEERARIAKARGEEPARLAALLRGDLDWIVARAMEKDRDRRYQTVNALAADLRRFLAHEPVSATRPGKLYLAGKFIRRNRVACLSGAAVVMSLVAGLGASLSMYFSEREALAKQEWLSREAEAARARETWLSAQAQARANVSQAAVLLADGKDEEADALLRESPLESIEPSREAAAVFRALGNRSALNGHWKQAVKSFILLDQANRLDVPTRVVENIDLLMIAPALVAHGEPEAYDRFRRETLDRYLPATNSIQAEHILKVCLLTPAPREFLRRLEPVAEVCRLGIRTAKSNQRPGWEAFSMTLYHLRLNDLPGTEQWAQKTLSYPDSAGSRIAATLCLRAMAESRAGKKSRAAQSLAKARQRINHATHFGPTWSETIRGTWYSWVVAQILLREAERELGGGQAAG